MMITVNLLGLFGCVLIVFAIERTGRKIANALKELTKVIKEDIDGK